MHRKVIAFIAVALVSLALGIVVSPATGLYDMTVRVVSSTGTVLTGTVSAVTGLYDKTVRIVNSNNQVIDNFAGTGATYCTPLFSQSAVISFNNASANAVIIWPAFITLPYQLTWSHICVNITTLDAVGFYDIAVAPSGSGTTSILAETGARHYPATGVVCSTILQNAACTGAGAPGALCTGAGTGTNPVTVTSQPGNYRLITTGNATTALMEGNASTANLMMPDPAGTGSASTNGVGPATFTAVAPAPTITGANGFLEVCIY